MSAPYDELSLELVALVTLVMSAEAGAGRRLIASYQARGGLILQRDGHDAALVTINALPITEGNSP